MMPFSILHLFLYFEVKGCECSPKAALVLLDLTAVSICLSLSLLSSSCPLLSLSFLSFCLSPVWKSINSYLHMSFIYLHIIYFFM